MKNFLNSLNGKIKEIFPGVKTYAFGLLTSVSLSGVVAQDQLPFCEELSYDVSEVSYVKLPHGTTLQDVAVYDLPELHTKKSVYHTTERLVNGLKTHEKVLMNRVNGVGNWKNGIRVTEFDNKSIKNYKLINGVKQLVRTHQFTKAESNFFSTNNSLLRVKGLLASKQYIDPQVFTKIFTTPPRITKVYTIYEDREHLIKLYKLNSGGTWHFITNQTLSTYTETGGYNKVKTWVYRHSIFDEPLEDLLGGNTVTTGGSSNPVYEKFVQIYTPSLPGVKLISYSSEIFKDTLSNGLCVDRVLTEQYDNYAGCVEESLIQPRSQHTANRADINVFPNPFRGDVFTIALPKDLVGKNLKLELFDATGIKIVSQQNQNSGKEILFSGMMLENGIYFLRISGDNVLHTKTLNVIR